MSQEHSSRRLLLVDNPCLKDDGQIQLTNEQSASILPGRSPKSSNYPQSLAAQLQTPQRWPGMMSLSSIMGDPIDGHHSCSDHMSSSPRGSFVHPRDGKRCLEDKEAPLSIEKVVEHTENHRTYHGFHKGKYMLPNDEEEQDRLDFLHHALLQVTGRLTYVSHPTDGRVLDLGCGTGIWAIDFAKKFPDAFVLGVDLSLIQPTEHPANCDFYAPFDYEFPWQLGEESWDMIRLQMGSGSVANWPSLYRRVVAHLRPGAWFEQIDIDLEPKCENRSLEGSALYSWYHRLKQATNDAARPISQQFGTVVDQLLNAGFTDIEHEQFQLPLNRWHPDTGLQHIGHWYGRAFFDAIEPLSLAPFYRILEWPLDEIQRLITDAKSEMLDPSIHSFQMLHIYKARKKPKQ